MAKGPSGRARRKGAGVPSRRHFIFAAATMLAAALLPQQAQAQGYPERPISYIVPSSPGSSPDVVGRVMAEALSKVLGQPVVVVNRAGAGGTVAAATAARAAPDGYTILQANTNHSFSHTLYKNLNYDLVKDFKPVSRFASAFYIIVAHPKTGVRTIKELVDKAKAEPGKLNFASGGIGAATFIVTEVLKARAGIDMVHIPYNGGGPALASIVSGATDVYGSPYATAKPFVEQGKLVGLGVTTEQRIPFLPQLPTVAETIPGYEMSTWYGLLLPAATPTAIRDKLQSAIATALAMPETHKRLEDLGYVSMTDTPDAFARFLPQDIEKMAKVIRDYDLKPQ